MQLPALTSVLAFTALTVTLCPYGILSESGCPGFKD